MSLPLPPTKLLAPEPATSTSSPEPAISVLLPPVATMSIEFGSELASMLSFEPSIATRKPAVAPAGILATWFPLTEIRGLGDLDVRRRR